MTELDEQEGRTMKTPEWIAEETLCRSREQTAGGRRTREQTNAELITEANKLLAENQWTSGWGVESLAERLADALEAAEKRAENAEGERDLFKREQVRLAARCDQAQNERDALASVVEKAEDFVTRHYLGTRFGDEVLPILTAAGADALREVKAEVWDEAFAAGVNHDIGDGENAPELIQNPYREEQS